MANILKVKRSAVPAKVPTTSDLELGEIAVNTYDGKMYIKKDDGTPAIVQIGAGGAGTGDVVGPASATDNAISRYDGITGKLIQNSSVTVSDNGDVQNVNSIGFDTTPGTLPTADGTMFWDTGNGTPSVILNPDVTLQLGQESVALVYNGTGSTITNGSVVAVSGAQGQRPSVVLADADSEALSAPTLGIATQDIANGAEGFITVFGFVRGLDTSAFTAGDPIYLSQTAGQFTATRPAAPAHTVALGWVIKVNASSGEIFVNINNGWELDELHNVLITSPTSGNTLIYDASASVWKNANLTDGTGISVTEGAGSITVGLANDYGDTLNPYASKTANYFLASPDGTAGVPSFRAIVAADIPTLNQNTTGTATYATNISGGAANKIPYQTGAGATSFIDAPTVASTSLTWNGSAFTWASAGGAVTISNDITTATNLYPTFVSSTSGTASTIYTSDPDLLYKPSTGEFQASALNATNGIIVNAQTITGSYTIATGTNGMSAGPVTIANGISVTVSDGSVWTVV